MGDCNFHKCTVNILYDYALSFVGKPYIYGGSSLVLGTDCSGFVCELLRSVGLNNKDHLSAQMLFDKFQNNGAWNISQMGSLAFFGADAKNIEHVAMLLDQYRMIEAGGGDSTTLTVEEAAKNSAMVRVRLLSWRKDLRAIIRPNYATIGLIK